MRTVSIQSFISPLPCHSTVTLFSYFCTLTFPLFNRKHFNLPICLKLAWVIHLLFHKYLLNFFSSPVLMLSGEDTDWARLTWSLLSEALRSLENRLSYNSHKVWCISGWGKYMHLCDIQCEDLILLRSQGKPPEKSKCLRWDIKDTLDKRCGKEG